MSKATQDYYKIHFRFQSAISLITALIAISLPNVYVVNDTPAIQYPVILSWFTVPCNQAMKAITNVNSKKKGTVSNEIEQFQG